MMFVLRSLNNITGSLTSNMELNSARLRMLSARPCRNCMFFKGSNTCVFEDCLYLSCSFNLSLTDEQKSISVKSWFFKRYFKSFFHL